MAEAAIKQSFFTWEGTDPDNNLEGYWRYSSTRHPAIHRIYQSYQRLNRWRLYLNLPLASLTNYLALIWWQNSP